MSESPQLEQLLSEKASIEDEGRELDDEQRKLKARAKVLTEKIIQELKKRNNAKQDTLSKLQSQVDGLEAQLDSLSVSHALDTTKRATIANEESSDSDSLEEATQTIDDTVSVTEVAEPIVVDAAVDKDRRKRKFF